MLKVYKQIAPTAKANNLILTESVQMEQMKADFEQKLILKQYEINKTRCLQMVTLQKKNTMHLIKNSLK